MRTANRRPLALKALRHLFVGDPIDIIAGGNAARIAWSATIRRVCAAAVVASMHAAPNDTVIKKALTPICISLPDGPFLDGSACD